MSKPNKSLFNHFTKLYFILIDNKFAATALGFLFAAIIQVGIYSVNPNSFELGPAVESISIATTFFIAALLYFKSNVTQAIASKIMKTPYTALIGLSPLTKQLLDNEVSSGNTNYLIIDSDKKNASNQFDEYSRQDIGILCDDIFKQSIAGKINFHTMEKAIISLGNDILNIEAATALIKHYQVAEKRDTPIRIIVEINDRNLNELFYQNLLNSDQKNKKIEIQTFSFYAACAEQLFDKHDVDANNRSIIESETDWHIAVVGEGFLLKEIVFQIGLLAHLPNQNHLTLHIVHHNAEKLEKDLINTFTNIEKVMSIETHKIDANTLAFYQDPIWKKPNLTRVFVCDDNEEKNISIATNIFNKTYLQQAVHQTMVTEIFFAIFNGHALDEDITSNNANLKSFHTFGDINKICTPEIVIQDEQNLIARLIHDSYGDEYDPSVMRALNKNMLDKINKKWFDTAKLSDKLSSQAQAKHIRVKLKALNLTMEKSSFDDPDVLLKHNRQLLDATLEKDRKAIGLDDKALKAYSKELEKLWNGQPFDIKYFPKTPHNLFEKLIHCEHVRWNAFHYMNGWNYAANSDKLVKEHACLKPLVEFNEPELQITVIYDIYTILYIPNYLTSVGYMLQRTR